MSRAIRARGWRTHALSNGAGVLLRIALVYNIPIACNRATADFLQSSPLMHTRYDRIVTLHRRTTRRRGEIEYEHN